MFLTGIGDEAGASLEAQIRAAQLLGWRQLEMRTVEVPGFPKGNLHDIPAPAFDLLAGKMDDAGLHVFCVGSAIANWSKKITDPFAATLDEVQRCVPRLHRLGTKFVRIMSYKPGDDESEIPPEVFRRVREITKIFLAEGIQPLHENCMNYGGMSARHARQLLEECPGLKWLFDTANPVFNADRSRPKPWPRQDPWEFWERLRDYSLHIHVKDGVFVPAKNDLDYRYPGEGDGQVRKILADALGRGYDAGISIEPHVAVVFHDASSQASAGAAFDSFVKYARQLEAMLREISAQRSQ